jgi:hypothetical protein
MGSNPIIGSLENAISRGKIVRIRDFIGHARSRTKTHEKPVYSSSIRQGRSRDFGVLLVARIRDHEASLARIVTLELLTLLQRLGI